ncbi:NnrS family protein [Sinorhizobium saheli]|uniref:Short-chain dehydrogenase n=1 Tax=Sinorhizobium saheli TaxID=36856 RepID=A0A178YSA4_SINSA|nr:NnrS family protein [Sinorhizobium saheli]OAP50490.1 short-chain dehydrogenase [Sinorhizobium saheli]
MTYAPRGACRHAFADWQSIWRAPYRPLFFLAGLWALAAPMVWLLAEETAPGRIAGHSRELLFGMAGAAAGGYLLTALPAWTSRGPVAPAVTVAAAGLWCLGRLTVLFAEHLPVLAAEVGACAYFAFLTAILAHGVLSAEAWYRYWAPLATAALGINAALGEGVRSTGATPLLYVVLVVLVGGRAVPALTRHWLERTGRLKPFRDRPTLSHLAILGILAAIHLGGVHQHAASGLALIFSGMLLMLQMATWQTLRTRRYPALFMLHIAFAWTPAALGLNGLSALFPEQISPGAALHALTMGAMGTMISAFMMRSAMAREGERLIVSRVMAGAFALVSLSALLRVLDGWLEDAHFDPVPAAAVLWIAAWALFLVAYIPAMRGPVPRPVFSAAIRNRSQAPPDGHG